jgi:hypothetical protein
MAQLYQACSPGPAIIALLALFGLYDLAIEVNGHRIEFSKPEIDCRAAGGRMYRKPWQTIRIFSFGLRMCWSAIQN